MSLGVWCLKVVFFWGGGGVRVMRGFFKVELELGCFFFLRVFSLLFWWKFLNGK